MTPHTHHIHQPDAHQPDAQQGSLPPLPALLNSQAEAVLARIEDLRKQACPDQLARLDELDAEVRGLLAGLASRDPGGRD